MHGKSFRLADEVGYIQRRAADRDGRIVTIAQLVLFSTEIGDAWLLDPSDQLAAPLARDGYPEPIHIEETDSPTRFTGKVTIALRDQHSFTSMEMPGGSLPCSDTRLTNSFKKDEPKISNMFG